MRTPVPFFVSYAHVDMSTANRLLRLLTEQLLPSQRYDYSLWRDTGILVGEPWHAEIQQALEHCQVGLLLVSPAFLASPYITQHELPSFLGEGGKPIISVMLKAIDWQRHDTKGLAPYQMFRLDNVRAFAACTTETLRQRFVETLFHQMELRLDRLAGQP